MRILQIFNRYRDRGGEQEWVERLPSLVDNRSSIETLQFDSRDWLNPGSPSKIRQSCLIGNNPTARRKLAAEVKRFNPDLLLFHNLIPVASLALYKEAANLGIPVAQYLHNYRPFSVSGFLWADGKINDSALRGNPWPEIGAGAWNDSPIKTAILAWHLSKLRKSGALESVRLWIAVSEFMKEKMVAAGLPVERVVTLRHCWPIAADAISIREGEHYLFLGHLATEKGVLDLLTAWRFLEQRLGPACPSLVIAGAGPLEKQVRAECSRTTNIRFVGHVTGEEKDRLLRECRALLAPSAWWEPLGLIVYEAYEHFRPVIASLSGGLVETVQPGITGLSHAPSDALALCRAVEEMEKVGAPARAQMGLQGHNWLRDNCSPTSWNESFHEALSKVIPSPKTSAAIGRQEKPLKISVVTACYNQEATIERTIKSILGQNYPNLEYIIVDGASKDSTMDIINRDSARISRIISEPDDGQYHAIQKGLDMATGDVMAWLNGDDMYFPWTFRLVNEIFTKFPDVDWIMGLPTFTDENDILVKMSNQMAGYPRQWIVNGWYSECFGGFLQQESMFWRKSLWDRSPKLDLSLKLAGDFKLWTDFAALTDLVSVSVPLGSFRDLPNVQRSVVMRDQYLAEVDAVTRDRAKPNWLWRNIAPKGLVARSACRLFMFGSARSLIYGRRQQKWHLIKTVLPVSRNSLTDLKLEYLISKQNSG